MRTTRVIAVAAVVVSVLVAGACGGDSGEEGANATTATATEPASTPAPSAGAAIPGGGLTIEDAIASPLEGPLMVSGYIVAEGSNSVRLCTTLAESYPPQCGGPSLAVSGLELETFDGLTRPRDAVLAGAAWSDEPVSLLGEIEDGVITVSQASI